MSLQWFGGPASPAGGGGGWGSGGGGGAVEGGRGRVGRYVHLH